MLRSHHRPFTSQKLAWWRSHWLNIWDVGGQRSLRSYWRNYYERTDALIWVVDSADTGRMLDCKAELQNLLKEEKLAGAALLIFANKQDLPSALSPQEITKVGTSVFGSQAAHSPSWHGPAAVLAAEIAVQCSIMSSSQHY